MSVIIPFAGKVVGSIVIPVLSIVAVVLVVRRAGTVQYGNSIVVQNPLWTLISLGIAIACFIMQIVFLVFFFALGGQ